MENLKIIALMVLVAGISSVIETMGLGIMGSVSAQVTTDNATNATMATQGNMTAGTGNMTGKISMHGAA
jgi:hypothetical protein